MIDLLLLLGALAVFPVFALIVYLRRRGREGETWTRTGSDGASSSTGADGGPDDTGSCDSGGDGGCGVD